MKNGRADRERSALFLRREQSALEFESNRQSYQQDQGGGGQQDQGGPGLRRAVSGGASAGKAAGKVSGLCALGKLEIPRELPVRRIAAFALRLRGRG